MKESVTFLDCPASIDADDGLRWRLPAHVQCQCIMNSTGGPLEGPVTNCPAGHHSSGPFEFLTFEVYPGSGDTPGWRLGSDGFCIVLTAGLTSVIGRWLGDTVTSFLAEPGHN